jgi:DNA-binding NtrC family response regulator
LTLLLSGDQLFVGRITTMNPGSGVLGGRRILVVEDEAMVSMMLVDILTSAGGVVIGPAGSTKKALALIEQETIHCAILDVKLTDGMSVPVAEALAARGIPYVIASGYSDKELAGYSATRIVRKVYTAYEVIEAIADVLRP